MDHLLPILTEEEYKAEIELCDEAIDPDEVDNVIKRWLRLYLPRLKPGELTQEALDIIKCRDAHTEKMTQLSRRYRRLMENQKSSTNQLNVSASDAYTTHAGPSTSSSSVTAPPAHSPGTPTFTPSSPAASSLPIQIPNLPTSSSSSVTEPPAHSTGTPIFNPPRPAASSTPMQTQSLPPTDDCKYTVIGPNGTTVYTRVFQDISFKEPTTATRRLLSLVFTEEVLAKNTLSGKPSPAFKGRERPLKGQLDPDKISDVIHCITSRTDFIEKNVRTVITAKCADSAKKIKKLQQKQQK
ncbi:early boundary activity protein 2-like isoform X2 [Bactrocera dorsalis]|uniref:Early boundary activity protein 2-like isoform X2 n=1 Tax=Bactrocera dorsalis TaxID=27457 RepID=A0ABM3JKC1_BACDO|nr:early boundary activity protein 2-like isoform X2 [Bactrocera dorsalis]